MSYLTQKTIKSEVSFNGIALHSGVNVNVSIKPAEPNFGIVFKRIDLKSNNLVYPNFNNVTNTFLNTTVENEFGAKVSTIEHLMGAFYGAGIDNARVEVDSEEIPIMDGSAKCFVDRIKELTRELISDGIKYNVKFYVNDVEKDESTANAVEKLKEEFGRLSDEEIEVKNAFEGVVSVLVPAKAWVSRTRQERLRKAAEEGGGVTTETPREET